MSLGVGGSARVVPTSTLRAFAHPTRLQILSLLTGAAMTAAEVARELSLTHANASYHLRQLHAAGAIQVAGEERIRGGRARRYRYVIEDVRYEPTDLDEWSSQRQALFATVAAELRRRSGLLRPVPDHSLSVDAELWVSPQLFDDVRRQLAAATRALHEAAQPPRSEGTIRVNATVALFEMEPSA